MEDRDVHFHVLQNRTKSRIKQQMVRPDGGERIAPQDIQKGYEVEPGTFVVIEDKELDRLKPKESREIKTPRFLPPSQIGPEWYERPYFLAPDGEECKYFALAEALRKRNVYGTARWSMRGKSYVGALLAEGDYLVLIKLRYAQEVLSARELSVPASQSLNQKELRMAEELVSALEGKFQPDEFRDEYRERVMNFIEAKAKGRHPRLPSVKQRTTAASLNDQLEKSLAALKRRQEKKVA